MIYPDFKNNEILPAIIQDEKSKTILMLGYMNEEAYKLTLKGFEKKYDLEFLNASQKILI